MTRRPRRNYNPAFKAKVALSAIKREQTLMGLSQQFDVNAKQVKLLGGIGVFGEEEAEPAGFIVDVETLRAKIGD